MASMQFAWIARDGGMTPISDVFDNTGQPAISPDGTRVAGIVNEGNNNGDIWVFDLIRGTRQRLSFDPAWDIHPTWSPDGKTVYYVCTKDGIVRKRRADGTGDEQMVIKGWVPNISPDGTWIAFDDDNPATSSADVFLAAMPADTSSERRTLISSAKNEGTPRISPSGDYLAYESDESGRDEIYLTRFPSAEGKWQVSVAGGTRPRWDPAGGRMYFTSDAALMEVDVTEKPELRLGNPRQVFLFDDVHVLMGRSASYDVERGGKRFVMSYNASSALVSPKLKLVIVENWPAEFKKAGKK